MLELWTGLAQAGKVMGKGSFAHLVLEKKVREKILKFNIISFHLIEFNIKSFHSCYFSVSHVKNQH